MSASEVLWRVQKALQARLEKRGIGLAAADKAAMSAPSNEAGVWGRPWLAGLEDGTTGPRTLGDSALDPVPYRQAADRIMAGYFDVFALRAAPLGFPPRWNRDPKTGIESALVFGKTLDYRDPSLVGDIKYLWEPNRHYELVTLAQAFHLTRDARYANACRTLLESWFDQCPYPLGQGWSSALENAIRLTNWAIAWQLLGGARAAILSDPASTLYTQRWMMSIHQHCHFIAGHLSRHSSANNHLLGECMGLFIGATTWSCWPQSRTWQRVARDEFERQALCQNAADGVNREQAIWYQHEVADMMLLCGLAGRANGIAFSDTYWARLAAMLTFIDSLMDRNGNVPMVGDADDAVMVRLSREPDFHPYRSLLASGAVLFERSDFKLRAQRFDQKNRWLLGQAGADRFAALAPLPTVQLRPDPVRQFAEGGYYLLGTNFDTDQEIRVLADAGPLGYLSIAAHGHADALALTLSAGGEPLLIDPGTYAYHTEAKWRRYFRGTAAHNTVRVDGCDQSVQGGNFMWLQQANASCEHWQTGAGLDCFIGSHDGYQRLKDPLRHRRKITLDKRTSVLTVEDSFECIGAHDLEWHWHLAETCRATIQAPDEPRLPRVGLKEQRRAPAAVRVQVRSGPVAMTIILPGGGEGTLTLAAGQDEPPLGWVSHRFDEKQPAPSIVWRERICGNAQRTTVFQLTLPVASAAASAGADRTVAPARSSTSSAS